MSGIKSSKKSRENAGTLAVILLIVIALIAFHRRSFIAEVEEVEFFGPIVGWLVILWPVWILLYFLFKNLLEAYNLYLTEQGVEKKPPFFVRLADGEWLKAFVIGIASSICASLIMLIFFNTT